jgi:hypothetical protein
MRPAELRTMGLLMLCACESVEPSGTPFQPVAAPSAAGSIASATALTPESDEPKFRMSFDGTTTKVESGPADLVAKEREKEAAADAKPAEPGALDGLISAALAAPEPHSTGPSSPPTGSGVPFPTSSPPVADPTQTGGGWPVRLVKTIPNAQPPRAVIGLPSGKEIVVTPGMMLPEEGLVVVAVGPDRVTLTQITPQGDHAGITSFTLQAMY